MEFVKDSVSKWHKRPQIISCFKVKTNFSAVIKHLVNMYSSSDFEHLFIRHKTEAVLQGDSTNLFHKWYKDTTSSTGKRTTIGTRTWKDSFSPVSFMKAVLPSPSVENSYKQGITYDNETYTTKGWKICRETGEVNWI